MSVRLTQIDGKLPNLALMKIAAFHRAKGDEIIFTKQVERGLFEPAYDVVYGSAIFSHSLDRVTRLKRAFPDAIVGGTYDLLNPRTVEETLSVSEDAPLDYSPYPSFDASIGFTQRGCRLKCGFCVVPKKEGRPRSVNSIADIWRGAPHPKRLMLLDNDFFGQPREQWQARLDEIRLGAFKVCLCQGVNVRMIDDESAAAIASIGYYDDSFTTRRLYTAWDNIGDEERFFRGVDTLERHGVPPTHLMVYMLIGYDKHETWERVFYRLNKMVARGVRPFPMIYGDRHRRLPVGGLNARIGHKPLLEFQRWVIRRYYELLDFETFDNSAKQRATAQMSLAL